MRVVFVSTLLAAMCLAGLAGARPPRGSEGQSWEQELREMSRLLYSTSSVNVVLGLNLSEDQAVSLRKLAMEVEPAVGRPQGQVPLSPEVEQVRSVYEELRGVLLAQEPIDQELRNRVLEARTLQSRVLRSGLTYDPAGAYGDCGRCHRPPSARASEPPARSPSQAKEMAYAHSVGYLGNQGTQAIWSRSEAVDRILNENQKVMLEDFSCCLIPPQSLSEPVRIGQAGVPDWKVKLLQRARGVPNAWWPVARKKIQDEMDRLAQVKDPGLTEIQRNQARERLGSVLDEARGLSDIDFELKKEELCSRTAAPGQPPQSERIQRFKRAFFLLQPGSREAYDRLLGKRHSPGLGVSLAGGAFSAAGSAGGAAS
ncbi:MAG: hypothetical protein HY319_18000 [Armatimonadetes bacterium]|nr:hypothetical protein [Armatimonadota bacterium]